MKLVIFIMPFLNGVLDSKILPNGFNLDMEKEKIVLERDPIMKNNNLIKKMICF